MYSLIAWVIINPPASFKVPKIALVSQTPCATKTKTQICLLNLHLLKFVFQMKSVNHAAARRCARELQTKPVQFSALPTRASASSKLLHINLSAAVLVTLIVNTPY